MQLYNVNASKKAVNVSINSDLLANAKLLNINISKTLEDNLIKILQEKQKQLWLDQNKAAIEEYNNKINNEGLFGDRERLF